MPTVYESICKTCKKPYRGYGKYYCSPECRDSDPELHKRRLANRTGRRRSPTDDTRQRISKSVKKWHKEVGVSEETRRKHSKNARGSSNPKWGGGEVKMGDYWHIWQPFHPRANIRGYVKKAIVIAEKHLGRFLNEHEIIHHINSDKSDDEPKNLYLFPNESKHRSFHAKYQGRGQVGNKPPLLTSNLPEKK